MYFDIHLGSAGQPVKEELACTCASAGERAADERVLIRLRPDTTSLVA